MKKELVTMLRQIAVFAAILGLAKAASVFGQA